MIRVVFNGREIAHSGRTKRVLETSHPPVYYIPPEDVDMEVLHPNPKTTYCEWKGKAGYYDVIVEDMKAVAAAWSYQNPRDQIKSITGYVAFYANKMEACYVAGERV